MFKRYLTVFATLLVVLVLALNVIEVVHAAPPTKDTTTTIPATHLTPLSRNIFGTNSDGDGTDISLSQYWQPVTEPEGGYWIWTGISRYVRASLKTGDSSPPVGTPVNLRSVVMYFVPLFVFLASILITFLGTCCTGCCMCCCPKGRLSRRQKDPYTFRQIFFTWLLLIAVYFAWIASIIGGVRSGPYSQSIITSLHSTTTKTFLDASAMINSISPSIDASIDTLQVGISNTIDSVPALFKDDMDLLGTSVVGNITLIATDLGTVDGVVKGLPTVAKGVDDKVAVVKSSLGALKTAIDTVSTKISTLNGAFPLPSSNGAKSYMLKPANKIPIPATVVDAPLQSAINNLDPANSNAPHIQQSVTQALSSVPDLAGIASQASGVAGSLVGDINGTIQTALDGVKSTVTTSLDSQRTSVHQTIDDKIGPIDTNIKTYQSTADTYVDYGPKYVLYWAIANYVLFGLAGLVLLVIAMSIVLQKPTCAKCCLVAMIPLLLLFLFLAVLLLLISTGIGTACSIAFDRTIHPPNTLPNLEVLVSNFDSSIPQTISDIFKARDTCFHDGSLISVVISLGMVDKSQANITEIAIPIIMGQNLDVAGGIDAKTYTDQFDVSSAMSGAKTANDTINQIDISKITDVTNVLTQVDTAINASIAVVSQTFTNAMFVDSNGFALSGPEAIEAANDFNNVQMPHYGVAGDLTNMRTGSGELPAVAGALDGALAAMKGLIDAVGGMVTTILTIGDTVTTVKNLITGLVADVAAKITANTDSIHAQLIGNAASAQGVLEAGTSCKNIAYDTYDIQTVMCEGFNNILDSEWFALFFIGVVGSMAIPIFTAAANILADRAHASEPHRDDDGKKKKKGEKEGKKSGKVHDVESAHHAPAHAQPNWVAPGAKGGAVHPAQDNILRTGYMSPGDPQFPPAPQVLYVQQPLPAPAPPALYPSAYDMQAGPQTPGGEYDEQSEVDAESPTRLLAPTRFGEDEEGIPDEEEVEEMRPAWLQPTPEHPDEDKEEEAGFESSEFKGGVSEPVSEKMVASQRLVDDEEEEPSPAYQQFEMPTVQKQEYGHGGEQSREEEPQQEEEEQQQQPPTEDMDTKALVDAMFADFMNQQNEQQPEQRNETQPTEHELMTSYQAPPTASEFDLLGVEFPNNTTTVRGGQGLAPPPLPPPPPPMGMTMRIPQSDSQGGGFAPPAPPSDVHVPPGGLAPPPPPPPPPPVMR